MSLGLAAAGCDCNSAPRGNPDSGVDGGQGCQVTPCTGIGETCDMYNLCSCGPGWVWDDVASQCTPENCLPLTITNGTVTPATQAIFGDVATYGCNTDFQLVGTATRTCGDNGVWSGTAPTCVATAGVCLNNPCGTNGTCVPNGQSYICECAGGWTGPNCDMQIMCTGLVNPIHGTVVPTSALPGGTATYMCETGYTLNGTATTTCGSDGTWSSVAPTCDPVACTTLTAPANGGLTVTNGTYGATTTYSCDDGYALSGVSSRTCQADGTWSGAAPTCIVANDCSANPCQNGSCTDDNPGYTCTCTVGSSRVDLQACKLEYSIVSPK